MCNSYGIPVIILEPTFYFPRKMEMSDSTWMPNTLLLNKIPYLRQNFKRKTNNSCRWNKCKYWFKWNHRSFDSVILHPLVPNQKKFPVLDSCNRNRACFPGRVGSGMHLNLLLYLLHLLIGLFYFVYYFVFTGSVSMNKLFSLLNLSFPSLK